MLRRRETSLAYTVRSASPTALLYPPSTTAPIPRQIPRAQRLPSIHRIETSLFRSSFLLMVAHIRLSSPTSPLTSSAKQLSLSLLCYTASTESATPGTWEEMSALASLVDWRSLRTCVRERGYRHTMGIKTSRG